MVYSWSEGSVLGLEGRSLHPCCEEVQLKVTPHFQKSRKERESKKDGESKREGKRWHLRRKRHWKPKA
jgi:hypothetical protein